MACLPEAGALMKIGGGMEMSNSMFLCGLKDDFVKGFPTIPIHPEQNPATIEILFDELVAKQPELDSVLYNKVKICANAMCKKPNGFTLKNCNSCSESLEAVEIGKSENVFTAFVFGVARSPKFPYTMSLRRESDDAYVFDDLLQLCSCHLNVIPKKYYIPDWRFLLKAPKLGLEILDKLEAECWAAMQPFLENKEWRKAIYRDEISDADLKKKIFRSFNYPPSQYQLHIQWMVPPLLPQHLKMALDKNHFVHGRSYPVDYVRAILKLDETYAVDMNTDVEDIVKHFETKGVSYDEMWSAFFAQNVASTMTYQNWNPEDFKYVAKDGKAYEVAVEDGKVVAGAAVELEHGLPKVLGADKIALRMYGRPYAADGKPAGTYGKNPRKAEIGAEGYIEWPPTSGAL